MITFIHIPKTGGSTIKDLLKEQKFYREKPFNNHHTRRELLDCSPYAAVVRNPYTRIHSLYCWHRFKAKRIDCSFDEFVLTFDPKDKHFLSLYDYLSDEEGKISIDDILRFENLEEDYRRLCSKYGLEFKWKWLNKNSYRVEMEYTPEMIERINDVYSLDFKFFGYKKDAIPY